MSKVLKNYLYNMSYQILVMILPFITTPYVSRVLKPDGVGAYNYAYSIVSIMIVLAQLGTNLYGQREIAYVQNDQKKCSIVFEEIFLIRLISTCIIIPLYFLIAILSDENTYLLLAMSIFLFANIFDISWLYQGLEDFKKTAIRNIGVKLVGVCLIFLLVHEKKDLLIYTFILSGSQLMGNFTLWIGLNKRVGYINLHELNLKKHMKPILGLFLPTAAMYIYVYVDKILLGYISDNVQVGYYSQAEKIIKLLLTVITSLGAVLLPHISHAINQKDMKKVIREVRKAISFVIHIGLPMVFGVMIVSSRFIPLFLGEEYCACIPLFSILSVLIIIIGLASVVGQAVLVPMRKQKIYTLSIVAGASCNLVMDVCLIPRWGALGASVGTVAAELTVTTLQLYFVNKILSANIMQTIIQTYKCYIAVLLMLIIGSLLNAVLPYSIIYLVLIVLVCVATYGGTLLLLRDNDFLSILKVRGNAK